MQSGDITRADGSDPRTQTIGFAVLPGFALMSFAAGTEPLRAANILAGRALYDIRTFSTPGGPVASSSGTIVETEPMARAGTSLSALFVCAGGEASQWHDPKLHGELRRLSRFGVRLGGISGGAFVLAAAGLLETRAFTIHWEHVAALKEAFPALEPVPARYVVDRNRLTCGGGVAPLDMMHALITERVGPDFARKVSDWFLHTSVSEASAAQRASIGERYGVHHSALVSALERMEATLDQTPTRATVARYVGLSVRQLDRLFAGHLARSFNRTLRDMRVAQALRLLRQSPLSVADIGLAVGFPNAAHFSRTIRAETGRSPRAHREGRDRQNS